ncbi:MAG: hypothetical protein CMQ83_02110 [Gammaproteobacteria bacterium]|nr:hypothetical protein [Gammaproteobacteria bacterium]
MKFYKLAVILFIISIQIDADNIDQEYKIELLVYKYNITKTDEYFTSLYNIYKEDLITLDENNKNSDFSNVSEYIEAILNNDLIKANSIYPKIWLRDNSDITKLNKLKNQLINDKSKTFLESKSWIQTIPKEESSKFIYYSSDDYGFLIKLYKKRFMHIELDSFLKNETNKINKFIQINQRVFNEEIYLFDHPYFGVILSINEI